MAYQPPQYGQAPGVPQQPPQQFYQQPQQQQQQFSGYSQPGPPKPANLAQPPQPFPVANGGYQNGQNGTLNGYQPAQVQQQQNQHHASPQNFPNGAPPAPNQVSNNVPQKFQTSQPIQQQNQQHQLPPNQQQIPPRAPSVIPSQQTAPPPQQDNQQARPPNALPGGPPRPQLPNAFPPGQVVPGTLPQNAQQSQSQGSLPPSAPVSAAFPPGSGPLPPSSAGPTAFPPGPGGQGAFPPGPGGPGAYPPGPGAFPPGPGGPGAYPSGPGAFPPGPGGPGAFPPGPGGPGSFPPGPGGPGAFPPGPGGPGAFPPGPGSFPPGPGGPGAYPPGPSAPGMPGGYPGPPQQRQQRLDPNMMPSAVQVMDDDNARSGLFPTGYPHAEIPPLISTYTYAQDQGNCNPKFMRSTMYCAPQTNDLLKATQIPFSVVVSPFARLNELEREPPVVDLGAQGPVRCQRCKAYICPFMEFQDGGRRFRCPFCNASTPVEEAYFAHLDHTGRRTDIEMRPELFLGAYDLVATKQYCKNGVPPKEPAYIFLIDVSYSSISNGMVPMLCQNLEKVLRSLPRETGQLDSSIRIGLATFDQSVHFFDLTSATPKMMIMTDVQEPFVPLVEGLLLPYNEALPGLKAALAEIPKIFSPNRITETILQPAVQAGLDALKSADRAGKLIVFSTVLPTFDAPGKLKEKNERNLLGTDKEKTALVPQEESYTKLGEQCVKAGVSIDLFLFPNSFIDVATIGQMSAVTGGSIFKFQYFSAEKDGIRMLKQLEEHVAKKVAFDCMARVRTSTGIRPITFHGSFYMENSTDLELASIDECKAFVTEIKHDDKLNDQAAFVQTAVLYTSMTGQRRLRILNLCLQVTTDYSNLFRGTDPEALTTFMLKQAVQLNREKGNKEMRDQLSQRCAQLLAAYREKCSEAAPLGQLILPESLKLIPLYVNSILKNDAVSGGSEMTVDDKVWQMELVRGIRVEDTMALIYPRVYPISNIELPENGELTELPKQVRASYEYLDNTKAFIIDNGVVLFVWVGLGVAQEWVRDVFGVEAVTLIDSETGIIPEKDNAKSRALRKTIQLLPRGIRQRKTFLIIEKSGLEPWMKKFLIEDKVSPTGMSYVDFLCHMHREIRNLVS